MITIVGPVGSGKSTISEYLAERTNYKLFKEPVTTNPYLSLFYKKSASYAFPMQIFLLERRYQQLIEAKELKEPYIMDMSIHGNDVFAYLQHKNGFMTDLDYKTYKSFSDLVKSQIDTPKLMVYLKCSPEVCIERILKRGRVSELDASMKYWFELCASYDAWFNQYDSGNKITINVDELDIVANKKDREHVISLINEGVGLNDKW